MLWIKHCLLIIFLIAVSIKDIKTREIPDYYHIAISSLGFINFSPFFSVYGLFCVMPFLVVALLKNGEGIGGADIKFMMAIGFVLGFSRGLMAGIIGLVVFILFCIIKDFRKEKMSYPMIPFLAIGVVKMMFMG
jgi:leader peptidase (prepilin peptidase)/N-methyltransferase